MTAIEAERPLLANRRGLLPVQIAVGMLLALRLYFDFAAPPLGDEAYYWMWGQRPALSYFDHPPLHAWLLGAVSLVGGWNGFSLRVLTWLSFAGTLVIFWDWSKRLAPTDPRSYFWHASAIYLASPLFFAMGSFSFHDHLMIFLCFASAHFFLIFADAHERSGSVELWPLYGGAALLGLAVLTKYNAVFLGLGLAMFLASRPRLRGLFKTPHLYFAAALAIALQAPVFWWNFTRNFASYRFHLIERWTGQPPHFSWTSPLLLLLATMLTVSPFLVLPVVKLLRDGERSGFLGLASGLAISVFAVSSVAMLALSFSVEVYFYWNVVAFLLLMPLLVPYLGQGRQFWLHIGFGTLFATAIVFNYAVLPVAALIGSDDWGTAHDYGWEQIGPVVTAAEAAHPGAFVAATRYSLAAQLGFALHDWSVTAITAEPSQYDYWFDPKSATGRDALILSDDSFPVSDFAATKFKSVTRLQEITALRLGYHLHTFELYWAKGYAGK